jgi:hypothetical protein
MSEVTVVIGAGSIGQAIARRVSAGKQVLLADLQRGNAEAAAEVLGDAGFEVGTATVDLSSRPSLPALVDTATGLGQVTGSSTPPGLTQPGVTGGDPGRGSVRHRRAAGGARQRDRPRRRRVVIASRSGHRLAP